MLGNSETQRSKNDRIIRADVWEKTNGICWYCGGALNPFRNFTVDHLVPRKEGGSDDIANLFPCCKRCNSKKHCCSLEVFRERMERKDGLHFTKEQTKYLESIGVDIKARTERYVFYFERKDLK